MDEKQNLIHWQEVEPLCVLRLLRRKLWLILLAALIGAMSASIVLTAMVSRSYTSTATFVVTPRTGSSVYYNNISTTSDIAGIYSQLLQSRAMSQVVSEALDGLNGTISANQLGESNLIRVSVTSPSPKDALLIVQTVGVAVVGIPAADLHGLLVHQLDEILVGATYILGDDHRRIIGRCHHHAVHQLLQGQGLPIHQLHIHGAGGDFLQRILANCDHVGHIAVLQGHNGGHQFDHTGRIDPFIGIVGIDKRFAIHLVNDSGIGGFEDLAVYQRHCRVQGMAAGGDLRTGQLIRHGNRTQIRQKHRHGPQTRHQPGYIFKDCIAHSFAHFLGFSVS